MAGGPAVERRKLSYPKELCEPKDWLNFVQLDPFPPAWSRMGLGDEDLQALEIAIMTNPTGPPVVKGTGGLRKVRFAPASWNTGKSGAARVFFVFFPEYGLVALIYATRKNEEEELSESSKKAIKQLIEETQRYLDGTA